MDAWPTSVSTPARRQRPAPMLEVVEILPPPERPAGRVIPGEPADAAKEVVRLLREEAKVI